MGSSTSSRAEIEALIPHRDPFLFVDRIVARSADRIVTEWDVSRDLGAFRGHYPGYPVLPGVLISEFTFQSAACLFASGAEPSVQPGSVPVLTRIEDARFRRVVRPGETLRAEVEVVERLGPARYCKASVTCDGATVVRLRFTVAEAALAP
ncbi:MAG: beta-hydroxyacyl-ACP dehydratase [Planctomycetes bacterium]|nr:beta-hydroxyacyl-ACP dehydratase [Planctomycetota bacterium]